jgi:preprotein translocase subunit SecY
MKKLITIFKIPELSQKILITLLFLITYRIGYHIPLPMLDQSRFSEFMRGAQSGALGQVLGFVSMFSGGALSQATIFGWGVMPYISASIIFQLLASVYPPLEKLQKEGESGRKKINEYTRYATVVICLFQSWMYVQSLMQPSTEGGIGLFMVGYDKFYYFISAILIMTAGSVFLMWLGEQIDEYGIGNGISLIIMAGILARIPDATRSLLIDSSTGRIKESIYTLGGGSGQDVSFEKFLVLIFLFIAVVVAVVAITMGQRRIPTQSAKHVRGRRVFGGTRQFLPLKVNQAGVMPVIFASSLLLIPGFIFSQIAHQGVDWAGDIGANLQRGSGWLYNVLYIALIYFFCYFWTAITFNPKDMANNLKDYGSFIPGYRPGKSTSDYLEKVLMRITYVGAAFLAVIAIIPTVASAELEIPPAIATFYGGTSLLITVSVCLDLVQKINSHLVMRNYPGLTED